MKKNSFLILLFAFASLTGCASLATAPETSNVVVESPRSIYIVVERNPRLPADFLAVVKQQSAKRLPDAEIMVDDGFVNDRSLTTADRVIALRATRISPDYSFKPSDNSIVNGITDCLAGSSFGPGVIMTPCLYSQDSDFLEASVRNADGKTLGVYVAKRDDQDWFWVLPFSAIRSWLAGPSTQQAWQELIDVLYDKMLADQAFTKDMSELAKQE